MRIRTRRSTTKRACAAVLLLGAIGCDSTLETGYKPRPLNATEADRRAYYAPAFTPEADAPPKGASLMPSLGH